MTEKTLTREGFIRWLRERDGQPCGAEGRCPIAVYLDLPDDPDTNPNETAKALACAAGFPEFITWVDGKERPWLSGGWLTVTGDMAADYLEGKVAP
jgi:hypothetical protein